MIVPKFIIFFKNYFLETRGGPVDLRDQSEVADKGEMVSSLWSPGSLGLFGLFGLNPQHKKKRPAEAER